MSDEASCKHRRCIHRDQIPDLPSAMFPGRASFNGRTVSLEPINPRLHGDPLFAAGHDNAAAHSVWEYMPYGPFNNSGLMLEWLRNAAASADPIFYVIRNRVGDGLAGMVSLLNIRPLIGTAEIGHIWFAPSFQRTVQSTEALYLLMRHLMDDLAYRRLEWKCNAGNQASRRAALRLGFRYEGVFYNHFIVKGCNRDSAWYSLLDSEWSSVRNNFDRWLRSANFDCNGQQRSSLGEMNRALWSGNNSIELQKNPTG